MPLTATTHLHPCGGGPRFFAKLQMDETPSIRVNTTICLGKIAPYLTPASRERVLAAAFARCLKDNFSHARYITASLWLHIYSRCHVCERTYARLLCLCPLSSLLDSPWALLVHQHVVNSFRLCSRLCTRAGLLASWQSRRQRTTTRQPRLCTRSFLL
jgi:hypothetical protein